VESVIFRGEINIDGPRQGFSNLLGSNQQTATVIRFERVALRAHGPAVARGPGAGPAIAPLLISVPNYFSHARMIKIEHFFVGG
jgi:hypothetical protein